MTRGQSGKPLIFGSVCTLVVFLPLIPCAMLNLMSSTVLLLFSVQRSAMNCILFLLEKYGLANACSLFGAVGCIADDFKEMAPLLAGGVGGFRHRPVSLVRA